MNHEEAEAVMVDRELDDVAEKIKKLLLMSLSNIPQDKLSMRRAASEFEMVRTSRQQVLLMNADNSCNQIFVAFSELEREEETRQKLVLIRQITKANTDICSHGEGEGCKFFLSKV